MEKLMKDLWAYKSVTGASVFNYINKTHRSKQVVSIIGCHKA